MSVLGHLLQKLAVGGMPEKIVSAFQSIYDENTHEEAALNKCEAALRIVGKMEKAIESTSIQGNNLLIIFQNEVSVVRLCNLCDLRFIFTF